MKTVKTNIPEFKDFARWDVSGPTILKLREFKGHPDTKKTWLSIKRKSVSAAFKEFKDLYKPKQFFAMFNNESYCKDDTFPVYYKK